MPGRRRSWLGIAAVLGLAVVVGLAIRFGGQRQAPRPDSATFDSKTPLEVLLPAIRDEAEAKTWLETLAALRTGFLKFGSYGKSTALAASTKILDRFAIEQAPASWTNALRPVQDLLGAGMIERDPEVRAAALTEVGRLWSWIPGRTP